MRTQSSDTSPEAERVLIELLRQAPAWRKLQLPDHMSAATRQLGWAGIRSRHPNATPAEWRRRFAAGFLTGSPLDLWRAKQNASPEHFILC